MNHKTARNKYYPLPNNTNQVFHEINYLLVLHSPPSLLFHPFQPRKSRSQTKNRSFYNEYFPLITSLAS